MTTTVRGPARPAPGRLASTAGRLPSTPHPVVLGVSAIVLAVNTIALFVGAVVTGSSTDDGYHVDRLRTYLSDGWYVLAAQMDGASPAATTIDSYVYAPVSGLIGHAFAVVSGAEGWDEAAGTAAAMSARHVSVAVISVIGLIAVAALGRLLLGSWRWGLVAAAVLSAIPVWTGYGMFNNKDIPVAVGFTLATLGLALLGRRPAVRTARGDAGAVAVLAAGLVLAVGTRPGIWPALGLSAFVMIAAAAWLEGGHPGTDVVSALVRRIMLLAGGGVAAYGVLLVVYPRGFGTPLEMLRQSAAVSADYSVLWNAYSVTNGDGHRQPPPLDYVPLWLLNQLPLVVLALAAVGLAAAFVAVGRLAARDRAAHAAPHAVALVLVACQAFALPLAAIALHSAVYGGLRQMLLIFPAWALLATVGLRVLDDLLLRRESPWPRRAAAVAVAVGLVLPTADSLRLFPYGYTYLNEIATLQPIESRWPTDFYALSLREAVERLDDSLPALCGETTGDYMQGPTGGPVDPALLGPCTQRLTVTAYVPTVSSPAAGELPTGSAFWYVHANRFTSAVPDNCEVVRAIIRPLRGQDLVMSWVARCVAPG